MNGEPVSGEKKEEETPREREKNRHHRTTEVVCGSGLLPRSAQAENELLNILPKSSSVRKKLPAPN